MTVDIKDVLFVIKHRFWRVIFQDDEAFNENLDKDQDHGDYPPLVRPMHEHYDER